MNRLRSALCLACMTLVPVLVAPGALAQTPAPSDPDDPDRAVASETFRAAEAAFAEGRFVVAARAFEVAFRLSPHPTALYNAGLSWQKAGEAARAADAFFVAVEHPDLPETQRGDASERLEALAAQHGRVFVVAPDGAQVSVAHVNDAPTPYTVHLAPGEHEVTVTFPGGESTSQRVTAAAGAATTLTFADSQQPPPAPPPPPPPPPPSIEPRGPALAAAGWVTLALGVAAGGAGIAVGFTALSARDDFEASGNTDADARDRAASLRTATNILLTGAAVFAPTGLTLLVVDLVADDAADPDSGGDVAAHDETPVSASIVVTPMGLNLHGSF